MAAGEAAAGERRHGVGVGVVGLGAGEVKQVEGD